MLDAVGRRRTLHQGRNQRGGNCHDDRGPLDSSTLMGELWLEPTMPFSNPGHHPLACSDGRVGPYRFARKRGIAQLP